MSATRYYGIEIETFDGKTHSDEVSRYREMVVSGQNAVTFVFSARKYGGEFIAVGTKAEMLEAILATPSINTARWTR